MMDTEVKLNENALHMMKLRIMKLEIENAEKSKKNDKKMVDEIIRIIEEEAKCSIKD